MNEKIINNLTSLGATLCDEKIFFSSEILGIKLNWRHANAKISINVKTEDVSCPDEALESLYRVLTKARLDAGVDSFGGYSTRPYRSDDIVDYAAALAELDKWLFSHDEDVDDYDAVMNALDTAYSQTLRAHTVPKDKDDWIFHGHVDLFGIGVDSGKPSFCCAYLDRYSGFDVSYPPLFGQPSDDQFDLCGGNEFREEVVRDLVYHEFVFDNAPDLMVFPGDMEKAYPHLFE